MSGEKLFKLILLGEGGVGKTSIKDRFMGKKFSTNYIRTIGTDFVIKRTNNTILQIWDLAGQIEFSRIRKNYYAGASGAILIFDVVDQQSFYNLDKWIHEMVLNSDGMLPSILIANKIDLLNVHKQAVSDEEIAAYCQTLKDDYNQEFPVIRTSALTGQQINEAFDLLLKMIDK